jgi:hypothetical protein
MGILSGFWIAHLVISQLVAIPWLVPDLTAAGMIIAIGRAPARWWMLAAAAGVLSLLWTVRLHAAVYGSAVLLGALVRLCAGQWDISDARVQAALAACGALFSGLVCAWLDGAMSWQSLSWAVVRGAQTGLVLLWVRRWMQQRIRLPSEKY